MSSIYKMLRETEDAARTRVLQAKRVYDDAVNARYEAETAEAEAHATLMNEVDLARRVRKQLDDVWLEENE